MLVPLQMILLAIFSIPLIRAESFTNVQLLYKNLTMDRNIHMRPQKYYEDTTKVGITFTLLHLEGIDAVSGTVSVAGYFVVNWTDENLLWVPVDYNNTEHVVLSHGQIWKPPLINSNSVKEMKTFGQDQDGTYVTLSYDGKAVWYPGQKLDFLCNIDTTYFPFDTQICNISVIAWGFPTGEITLSSPASTVDTHHYPPNNEWDLTKTSVVVDNTGAPTVIFTMHFKRRPEFIVATLILPGMAMALLNLCVFILPQESGERTGFSITLLLAVIVFLTIAQDLLPSTALPRLSSFCIILMLDLIMSGMIVVANIISACIYYKLSDEDVPNWVQHIIRISLFSRCAVAFNKVHNSPVGVDEVKTANCAEKLRKEEFDEKLTWTVVANFWDKMSFIFFTLAFVGGLSYYFIDVSIGS